MAVSQGWKGPYGSSSPALLKEAQWGIELLTSKPLSYPAVVDTVLSKPVVLNLCYSDAFELQLPETPVRTAGGEGFWELQSKTPE